VEEKPVGGKGKAEPEAAGKGEKPAAKGGKGGKKDDSKRK